MITPGTPTTMWAAHDTTLDTFSFPMPSHAEARLLRNAQLAHLTPPERQRLFPIVPVTVVITPGPIAAMPQPNQATLFSSEARHAPSHANA